MITQSKPPRLPQLWSNDWQMGESIVVEAASKERINDSAYSLRRSRGPEIWFTAKPAGTEAGKKLWTLTRVSDKPTARRLQLEMDRAARMQMMIRPDPSEPEPSYSCVADVPHERWSQYGGCALMYELIQVGDWVWCPGIDAHTMRDRFNAVRQRFRRGLTKKYAYFEPAVWWTRDPEGTLEGRPACFVIGVKDPAEAALMTEHWKEEAELHNTAAPVLGTGFVAT